MYGLPCHTSGIALAVAFLLLLVFLRLVETPILQFVLTACGSVSTKGGFGGYFYAFENGKPGQLHPLILLLHYLKADKTPTDRYYVVQWEGETCEDDEILQVPAVPATRPTN